MAELKAYNSFLLLEQYILRKKKTSDRTWLYNSPLFMLASSFLLPITHGKPKGRYAEELLWQTCQMLLPLSCPILPFKAGKLKEHRSSSDQTIKICFTSKLKYNSHMPVPEDPALQIRWGHTQTTAYTESINWVINPGQVLLFLKLWTFRNRIHKQKNLSSGNVTAGYCLLSYFAWVLCIRKGIQI